MFLHWFQFWIGGFYDSYFCRCWYSSEYNDYTPVYCVLEFSLSPFTTTPKLQFITVFSRHVLKFIFDMIYAQIYCGCVKILLHIIKQIFFLAVFVLLRRKLSQLNTFKGGDSIILFTGQNCQSKWESIFIDVLVAFHWSLVINTMMKHESTIVTSAHA